MGLLPLPLDRIRRDLRRLVLYISVHRNIDDHDGNVETLPYKVLVDENLLGR